MLQHAARRGVLVTLLLLAGAVLLPKPDVEAPVSRAVEAIPQSELTPGEEPGPGGPGCHERPLRVPTGAPPRLACAEARAILAEMHARFAGPSEEPRPEAFPELVAGWLDPHGLWSAAPDTPLSRSLRRHREELLTELRKTPDSPEPCRAALALGAELKKWVEELSTLYDEGADAARPVSAARSFALFAEPIFQDDPVTRPARVLARRLGERVAHFARAYPELGASMARAAKSRYFPELSAEGWSDALLAAAVRAYVPLLDPHGAWAPLDEEWSLYAEDPGFDAGPRLWGEVTRTAVGVRVLADALPPLQAGDLVLAVDDVATAGMPLEQIEQLGRVEPAEGAARRVVALRGRDRQLRELTIDVTADLDPSNETFSLEAEKVRFGDGEVLVVRIPDVPEGLGDSVGRLLAERRDAALRGVLLDLRGNGGGSTEAAASVLGLFMPGAPLFPLAARGRLVEVMRASEPPPEHRWSGAVAALVDGYTASAAEMIAGALASYRRGILLGRRTFGKGCIQEYADDHIGRGVLRVTTLLYALPDGSAVQRAGLLPDITLPVGKAKDREADVGGSLPGYWGPDVRAGRIESGGPWPAHGGEVGPAADPVITAALRRLGATPGLPRPLVARRPHLRASSSVAVARP